MSKRSKTARPVSKGKCNLCGETFDNSSMTRHLKSCMKKNAEAEAASGGRAAHKTKMFHLAVEGRDFPEYWMRLEAPADATLAGLDNFLRDTWLECCGHLSAFHIKDQSYSSYPADEFDEQDMYVALGEVLRPRMSFLHEYDFGSTTKLALKVVSEREGVAMGGSIRVLARNDPPVIPCDACGQPATQLCTECMWGDGGWLCKKCAAGHGCDGEMLLPVVNSPRVGVCAYTG